MSEFVHLHNHSEYSLLDGACNIREMVAAAKDMGATALALTDHGVVHGLVEFYREATEAGIKAILGCEMYLAAQSRYDRQGRTGRDAYHLLLLAENEAGYHNLLQLCSRGHIEGFYYKPRIDKELLQRYHQGIIACSACLAGEVAQLILAADHIGARRTAKEYADIFGRDNFFLELQDHGLPEERRVNMELLQMAKELALPVVASNDTHYLRQSDAFMHDILLCIQTNSRLHDRGRMRFTNDQYYLKSAEEMQRLFSFAPQALHNTSVIAERCSFAFNFGNFRLPEYPLPPGEQAEPLLRRLVREGLQRRYSSVTEKVMQRADYELEIIVKMGFVGYFLIVWDFVRYAKEQGIDVGPGRGSVTGSLVAYALGITEVDPLHYDLLFERFLNPERITLPDIDIDFCFERRGEVIEYVARKYGGDHVAQIITFGTLGARSAVRDIARVMELSPSEADRIAKMIPFELEQSIDRAIAQSQELRHEIEVKPQIKQLFDIARQIEGKPRNISVHAAGVVITPAPLLELLPLLRPKDEGLLTQYAMADLEALGFLKMDFLGLRTLTILRMTRQMIEQSLGYKLELAEIPLDDPQTYAMLAAADTDGVFQLESPGMRKVLRSLKPGCIEDIIAANALHRPGPMEHIPEFVAAKNGAQAISYIHPKLEPILSPTYGVLVYQEQVMRIAHEIAGFSLGEADLLRRAMAKRDAQLLQAQRERFLQGAERQGVAAEIAENIFELIRPFSSYGFNKSHSAAYGILAYQTAWFKTHYPLQYAAALLSSLHGSPEQIGRSVERMRRWGIDFLPPHINRSAQHFIVEDGSVRFGLLAIKNMGSATVEALLAEREKGSFTSLGELCRRVGTELNKRTLEALIRSGALDSLGDRAKHLLMLPGLQEQISVRMHFEAKGQTSLLGETDRAFEETAFMQTAEKFSIAELQRMELEMTGYCFTQPMAQKRRPNFVKRGQVDGREAAAPSGGAASDAARQITLRINDGNTLSLDALKKLLRRYPGTCPVYLELMQLKRMQRTPREYWVSPDLRLLQELQRALGKENVIVV